MAQANRISKVFKLQQHFQGLPKESDVSLIEESVPPLGDEEFLAEAVYISVDPYVRIRSSQMNLGETMIGSQIAKVIESKNSKYTVGKYVVGEFGWRTLTIVANTMSRVPWIVPDYETLPLSLALGILGMPGNTAYFGLSEILKPKEGETLVVTGAGGAVGSTVGQIAKIKGCKVIGIAGTDEKGKWITEELGFDHFINYKTSNISQKLLEYAPNGIDIFFDNVGGEIKSAVIKNMNQFGRICICGSISTYNREPNDVQTDPETETQIKTKHLTLEKLRGHSYKNRWGEASSQMLQWIKEGKLKYRETITEGFNNTFKAFVGMLQGDNIGKAVVKVK